MSKRQRDNERLTGLLKQCWLESGAVYGYRKLYRDLRDLGEQCGINRVHCLMRRAGLRAQVGYRKPRARSGEQHVVTPNRLKRQFNPLAPNNAWVTDITYIKTHEGWRYNRLVLTSHYWLVNGQQDHQIACVRRLINSCVAS